MEIRKESNYLKKIKRAFSMFTQREHVILTVGQ